MSVADSEEVTVLIKQEELCMTVPKCNEARASSDEISQSGGQIVEYFDQAEQNEPRPATGNLGDFL